MEDIIRTVPTQSMCQNILDHLDHLGTIISTGTARGPVQDMAFVILSGMASYLARGTVRYLDMGLAMDTIAILDMHCLGKNYCGTIHLIMSMN